MTENKANPAGLLILPAAILGFLWWMTSRKDGQDRKIERILQDKTDPPASLPAGLVSVEEHKNPGMTKQTPGQPIIPSARDVLARPEKEKKKKRALLMDGRGKYGKEGKRDAEGHFLKKALADGS